MTILNQKESVNALFNPYKVVVYTFEDDETGEIFEMRSDRDSDFIKRNHWGPCPCYTTVKIEMMNPDGTGRDTYQNLKRRYKNETKNEVIKIQDH